MTVLEGIKVVELGVWIAGPAAAGMLADWGADVIKVESAAGDPQRHVLRQAGLPDVRLPPFEVDNRGKRSIVLDLKTDADRQRFLTLLDDADVFVTNLRLKALRDLGLEPATLRALNPRLIYGLITGYGSDGPDADRAGYDVGAFWARSGAAATATFKDAPPPGLAPSFGDHVTATTLVAGVCAALVGRATTGEGALVETSLLRTGMYAVSADLSTHVHNGRSGSALARHEAAQPLMNSYATSDGRWFWLLCLESERHFPNVARALDREDWLSDERFAAATGRYRHRRELIAELDDAFATMTFAEATNALDRFDVWWTPMNRPGDLLDDPQVLAAGGFVDVPPSEHVEAIRSISTPVDFDGQRPTPRRASPAIGEHTQEVLAELDQHPRGRPPAKNV